MNTNEFLELQRRNKQFAETPIGKAFNKLKNATIRAWVLDTEDSFTDKTRQATAQAHCAADIAEKEFKELLYRTLTGAYLKDAKDGVEKYWVSESGEMKQTGE